MSMIVYLIAHPEFQRLPSLMSIVLIGYAKQINSALSRLAKACHRKHHPEAGHFVFL